MLEIIAYNCLLMKNYMFLKKFSQLPIFLIILISLNSCGNNFNHNIMKMASCGCYFSNVCVKENKAVVDDKCVKCSKNLLQDALADKNCKINIYKIV